MIDREMVLATVLARIQAQGKDVATIDESDLSVIVREAVDDLKFADDIVSGKT